MSQKNELKYMDLLKFQFEKEDREKLEKIKQELNKIYKKYGAESSALEFHIITPGESFIEGNGIGLVRLAEIILDASLYERKGSHRHLDRYTELTEGSGDSLVIQNQNPDEFSTEEQIRQWEQDKKKWIQNEKDDKSK